MNIKIIAWRYPRKGGLEHLIEKKKLYPITILPSLPNKAVEKLFSIGVIFAKDLLEYTSSDLTKRVSIGKTEINKLQREVRDLCLC